MGTPSGYTPGTPPEGTDEGLAKYLERELQAIARNLLETRVLTLEEFNVEPEKPRNGMIVRADGTNWDPGGGAGIYARIGGAWVEMT